MSRAEAVQLNIRSRFARERATAIARATGMTATQVVEEALRAYVPPVSRPNSPLIRKGPLLVMPATGNPISLEEANAALEEARVARD